MRPPIDIKMGTRTQKKKPVFEVIPNWIRYSLDQLEPIQIAFIGVNHMQ